MCHVSNQLINVDVDVTPTKLTLMCHFCHAPQCVKTGGIIENRWQINLMGLMRQGKNVDVPWHINVDALIRQWHINYLAWQIN